MEFLPILYLSYMFISLYFLTVFILIYIRNRKTFFSYPEPQKEYTVSFIVPAYNAADIIKGTIENIFNIDYKGILEVIVVNDCSKDRTREMVESLLIKYPKLRLINNPKNLGNAARSQNVGFRHARGEIIAIVDDDSYPARDSVSKMIGFFDDPLVGAVTCPVLARNKEKFFEKIQAIEYQVISFARKLLEYVDSIYVTPGPLALYRKKALDEIGGFDENNITQDIEATWAIAKRGWKRKMSLDTHVSSIVPSKVKPWFKQRRRWNLGGMQCIWKYRKHVLRNGMLGTFIIPFFIAGLFLGLIGIMIFLYLLTTNMISKFLYTKYSIVAGTPIITMNEFYITPNFLNYLGIILILLELVYLFLVFAVLKVNVLKKENILNIPFYLIVYLTVQPLLISDAIFTMVSGKRKWG
jgi:cellulose synthase/poly-beta-1,6-N-acetylglucosamine synthase-like glycosyltransferase